MEKKIIRFWSLFWKCRTDIVDWKVRYKTV